MTSAAFDTLLFARTGPVATITLNRPQAANGMNDVLTRELAEVAEQVAGSDAKAVVLTGAGRFFCAGGDLKAMAASPAGPGAFVKGIADDLHRAISIFARMDAVLITAVNGVAAGAGFSLAVAGDLVLTSEAATFTMAYTKAGLSPDGSASYYLPRLIGPHRTTELMLTNRTLSAAEALQWGLVNEVVPGDVGARATELAAQIATGAAQSSAAVKKLVLASFDNDIESQMALEADLISANADGADGREGIDAFLNKRAPKFA
ncbi:enoyl-CoA hydratase [Mycobacterium sp. MS1601]|uniref:enoyl-CoA hydratase/isomerase family protein n=1 Tax=Mycobacterium sp. MS1601 TaxID=1936029 RepID=UPI00097971C1|nr:enoyl-CoA hydratase-related protein [Mycobacterium sp. MS1601]AQA04800.1 enoyl-CoA hydratase [Mycobacterium sp. MS1601]